MRLDNKKLLGGINGILHVDMGSKAPCWHERKCFRHMLEKLSGKDNGGTSDKILNCKSKSTASIYHFVCCPVSRLHKCVRTALYRIAVILQ